MLGLCREAAVSEVLCVVCLAAGEPFGAVHVLVSHVRVRRLLPAWGVLRVTRAGCVMPMWAWLPLGLISDSWRCFRFWGWGARLAVLPGASALPSRAALLGAYGGSVVVMSVFFGVSVGSRPADVFLGLRLFLALDFGLFFP